MSRDRDAASFFEAVDLREVRMIKRGENLSLAAEADDRLRIIREPSREDLQSDVTTELRVSGR